MLARSDNFFEDSILFKRVNIGNVTARIQKYRKR
jgi:hypothetical protein